MSVPHPCSFIARVGKQRPSPNAPVIPSEADRPGAPSLRCFIAQGWESNDPPPTPLSSRAKPTGRVPHPRSFIARVGKQRTLPLSTLSLGTPGVRRWGESEGSCFVPHREAQRGILKPCRKFPPMRAQWRHGSTLAVSILVSAQPLHSPPSPPPRFGLFHRECAEIECRDAPNDSAASHPSHCPFSRG
jgi:hypothetical protein